MSPSMYMAETMKEKNSRVWIPRCHQDVGIRARSHESINWWSSEWLANFIAIEVSVQDNF